MPDMKRIGVVALLAVLTLVCGCGGEGDTKLTPAVEGKRLDVAQSDFLKFGVSITEIEVIGGGALGVIDESNWTVCEQDPDAGELLEGQVRLTVDRTCESG